MSIAIYASNTNTNRSNMAQTNGNVTRKPRPPKSVNNPTTYEDVLIENYLEQIQQKEYDIDTEMSDFNEQYCLQIFINFPSKLSSKFEKLQA